MVSCHHSYGYTVGIKSAKKSLLGLRDLRKLQGFGIRGLNIEPLLFGPIRSRGDVQVVSRFLEYSTRVLNQSSILRINWIRDTYLRHNRIVCLVCRYNFLWYTLYLFFHVYILDTNKMKTTFFFFFLELK